MSSLTLELPEKIAEVVFQPSRYKVFYGGRGGAKSWSIARALLVMGVQRPLRVLCGREIQKSIKDSVHQLLRDQINELGLEGHYQVLTTEIRGINGTQFSFTGLRHNAAEIKSHEGADICWVEEAHAVSKSSWDVLIPTIRKDGSEIWVSFNPELEDDETYRRFVKDPPSSAIVVKVNWSDNPWFPEVLRLEKDELKKKDPDAYMTVWEGHCKQVLDGAIYANELRAAKEEGRITTVPWDHSKPVETFWDLGWADNTSIWFAQSVGMEFRIVDFYQNNQQPIQHYLSVLQSKGYVYGCDHLPHDAQAKQLGTGRSIEEILRGMGRRVNIVPKLSVQDGINAARTIFPTCWFDEAKCADGLNALRHYRYDVDPDTGKFGKNPLHDWASHAADAFRYLGVGIRSGAQKKKPDFKGVFRR